MKKKCVEICITLRGDYILVDRTIVKIKDILSKCGLELHIDKRLYWKDK